jgi:hypothetical protein
MAQEASQFSNLSAQQPINSVIFESITFQLCYVSTLQHLNYAIFQFRDLSTQQPFNSATFQELIGMGPAALSEAEDKSVNLSVMQKCGSDRLSTEQRQAETCFQQCMIAWLRCNLIISKCKELDHTSLHRFN